ncbi:MAG: hypothetical protein ABJ327_16055 [Litoreibacter sp.]
MSLFRDDVLQPERTALVKIRARSKAQPRSTQSLFSGNTGTSLFAPREHKPSRRHDLVYPGESGTQIERIRYIIGRAESFRDGYDAVQHGAKIKPGKPPTMLTLADINHWIDTTPGQPHAIGRYQFIPKTLRRLTAALDVGPNALFNPELQDALSDLLLEEAGLTAFIEGVIGRHQFMNNLAKIWAGLPNSSGKSHYDGYAGNKASMTWDRFDQEMAKIFPS